MMYTQADAEKAVKVLFFEGAGCAERGDLENCRIRTAFRNDEGKAFYLELSGFEKHKWTPDYLKHFENVGHIDYCYELGKDGEKLRADIEKKNFEYSRQSILDFVNREMGCSFTDICITDLFYWYLVHKKGGGYNFMEDHNFDHEKAAKARNAFNEIDMKIRKQLGEKYSKFHCMRLARIILRFVVMQAIRQCWLMGWILQTDLLLSNFEVRKWNCSLFWESLGLAISG